ncbi:MAG TPA: hypothetical protein PKD96_04700, partial [Candidatus Absconditabacterales bacterium]|nr:hypothetical protein [Candidatus Absconditabacterales bacterium]
TYKKIENILVDFEFKETRQSGSHKRFEKGGMGVSVQSKTACSILDTIGLIIGKTRKDIIKLYKIKL